MIKSFEVSHSGQQFDPERKDPDTFQMLNRKKVLQLNFLEKASFLRGKACLQTIQKPSF